MASETDPALSDSSDHIGDIAIEPTNGAASGGGKKNGKRNGKDKKKEKEVPIEELYDLSQPIKRIERPSKDAHEAAIAAIDAEIEAIKSTRNGVQAKIDAALGNKRDLNKLKNRKGLMIEQKRQIRTKLEIVKSKIDRHVGADKSVRSGVKFSSVAEIDREISKLQRKQETSSMSLADEKRLIKEIESLQNSKRTLEDLKTKQGDIDTLKIERKQIQAELSAKDMEINSIQKDIDKQTNSQVDDLVKERDALKASMDEKFKEKKALQTSFREQMNDWFHNQRAIKAQRQIQYDAEKKRREEEHAAFLKKKEEEELKKTPYEEEMALCDFLVDYLQKTYPDEFTVEGGEGEADTEKKTDAVAVKDDPFAGMKAMKKDEDDFFVGKGAKSAGKKKVKGKKPKAANFSVSLDLWEQFSLLNLSPPTSLKTVVASAEELKAKKIWYSEQPRGSVPTARDIRKANSSKQGAGTANAKGGARNNGKKGNFSITSDEFVPLGVAGAVADENVNWGK
ncbi:hypothetical protein ACHAWO_011288 [Cyclotella atomus]|uniref:Uncharacterized protein n=1 Tax=Cyclotella atomus TaxID=382360 RepID=A0ABD3N0T7_9STRA